MQATSSILLFLAFVVPSLILSKSSPKGKTEKSGKSHGLHLYSESHYDWDYLHDYKKMIKSLIGPVESEVNMIKKEMMRGSEHRTASELYGRFSNHIPDCHRVGLDRMKTVKVLQDEESNYVMLKEDRKSGKFYVEKSTRSANSFDSELKFFQKLDPKNRHFPVMACYMESPGWDGRMSVVTEFIRGKESHLMAARASDYQLKSMVKQLFEAIVDLHRMGFIHADIKPGNVLVTDDYQVKLIDFGMATRVGHAKKYRGSPYTRAPELHDKCPGHVDVAIDWWAFGSTVAMWYYYHYNSHHLKHEKVAVNENAVLTAAVAKGYFQINSQYEFTPMKWIGGRFRPGMFPSSFAREVRLFLALFLTIDPDMRTFDSDRLHEIVRNHEYFH